MAIISLLRSPLNRVVWPLSIIPVDKALYGKYHWPTYTGRYRGWANTVHGIFRLASGRACWLHIEE